MGKTFWACAAVAALFSAGARADALDELMPVPRAVVRGRQDAEMPFVPVNDLPGNYRLTVCDGRPRFEGDDLGRRYAETTFRQLEDLSDGQPIPDCVITDWPEFRYRGLLLDCGRNYQSLDSIRDLIDHLARYKFNVFHWHIVDDYGWRLESKKYPLLQRRESFGRQPGRFYTQEEFKSILAYAKARGVTVIPELDMPGHTLAFRRATGWGSLATEEAKVMLGDLIDELCALASVEDMPILHIGTDEVREPGEKVPHAYIEYWANKVWANGRTLMSWSQGLITPKNLPLNRRQPDGTVRNPAILHIWYTGKDPRGGKCPYIDSQHSFYINHVDAEELLSIAAYQQPCRWGDKEDRLGAVIGVWHDDAINDTEDVARMNAVYPAVVLLSDSFWRGRAKDEPTLYPRLPPPDDPRFALAADLERRTVAQRDKALKNLAHPFPYVAQCGMRWTMKDADGRVIARDIPQATTYPRHFWHTGSAFVPTAKGKVTLETTIISPVEQDVGAWIDMMGLSRSDGRAPWREGRTALRGEWNRHGATIELNGELIPPPDWANPGVTGNQRVAPPLVDEGYWYRPPTRIHLRKGENTVKMTLPKGDGWKWIGTFIPLLGTSDHPTEVPGLIYRGVKSIKTDI